MIIMSAVAIKDSILVRNFMLFRKALTVQWTELLVGTGSVLVRENNITVRRERCVCNQRKCPLPSQEKKKLSMRNTHISTHHAPLIFR